MLSDILSIPTLADWLKLPMNNWQNPWHVNLVSWAHRNCFQDATEGLTYFLMTAFSLSLLQFSNVCLPRKTSGKGWGREQRWLIWETTSCWWQFWYLFLIVVAAPPPPTRQATGPLDMHEVIHWRVLRSPFSAQSLVWKIQLQLGPLYSSHQSFPLANLTNRLSWNWDLMPFLEISARRPLPHPSLQASTQWREI